MAYVSPAARTLKLEPGIDPQTKLMSVGGLLIPPTSTLTALLYGFAHHDNWRNKEWYFWRICDVLWNHEDLPEPLMVAHPWAKQMVRACLRNKYLAIGGAASSSKSHTMAAWGIVNWLSQPAETLVLITSTTVREAGKRIWGSVMSLMNAIEAHNPPCAIRSSLGSIAYVTESGKIIEKAGLALVASDKAKGGKVNTKLVGSKQKRVIVIGDELAELQPTIMQTAVSNLSKNPWLQAIGMSNPSSRLDAFGVWAEPEGGWDSIDHLTADTWRTKWGGVYLRLDGERSPNILAGEVLYPWLPTAETLAEDRAVLGVGSRAYNQMVRAVFFDADEAEGVYSEAELIQSGGLKQPEWAGGKPTLVAGLDLGFTNGGDRTVLHFGAVGYTTEGQYAFCFLGYENLHDDSANKAVPRTYQIVQQVRALCQKRGVLPENLAVDATGAGGPFCDVLAGEWSSAFLRVPFGGKASDRRVSANSRQTGEDLYTNRVSELWFVGKEFLRTRQLFGVSPELAQEITKRNYELVKTGSLRMKLESKADFKARTGSRSPDLADAAFLALDCARQRHGLVAMEPPTTAGSGRQRLPAPRRTYGALRGALQNAEACLVAD